MAKTKVSQSDQSTQESAKSVFPKQITLSPEIEKIARENDTSQEDVDWLFDLAFEPLKYFKYILEDLPEFSDDCHPMLNRSFAMVYGALLDRFQDEMYPVFECLHQMLGKCRIERFNSDSLHERYGYLRAILEGRKEVANVEK